jgi:transcriptional regulator with XRE-family HTH domain
VVGVIVARLKEAMAWSGLDQSGLAARIGCTPGAINQIITGRTKRSKLLPEIAHALGVSLPWLLGQTDSPALDIADLSTDEAKLLLIYRDLGDEDRAALKRLIERMQPTKEGN